jgi:hypothetical protein
LQNNTRHTANILESETFANISIKGAELNDQEIVTLATQKQACH